MTRRTSPSLSLPALVVCSILSGCLHVHIHNQEALAGGHGLEPGDRVVAAWQQSFSEATVITVQGKLVKIAWDAPPPEYSWLRRDLLVEREQETAVGPDSWGLCQEAGAWSLCRIESVAAAGIVAYPVSTYARHQFTSAAVLPFPSGLADWLALRSAGDLARIASEQRWAGVVPATAGKSVAVDQAVLALYQKSSWWSAKVVTVTGERITISWDDGGGNAVLDPNSVAPLPADSSGLAVGDRVYCRWTQGSQWYRAQITKNGQQGIEARAEDGTTQAIEPGQCMPTRTVI